MAQLWLSLRVGEVNAGEFQGGQRIMNRQMENTLKNHLHDLWFMHRIRIETAAKAGLAAIAIALFVYMVHLTV
jgi:hypothetical protein